MNRGYESGTYGNGRYRSGAYEPEHQDYRDFDRDNRGGGAWQDRRHRQGREHERSLGSLDTTGWIGMLIGGAVGYALTAAMRSGQSHSDQWREPRGIRSGSGFERHSGDWTGSSARGSPVETDETTDLIASNKVEGTAVYNRQGERLGDVYNFMVGKRSGRVAYAVMSFGGLLGMGQSYHPLPWNVLTYDTNRGGYVIDADKNRLTEAPSYRAGEDPFSQPGYGRRVHDYWSSGMI